MNIIKLRIMEVEGTVYFSGYAGDFSHRADLVYIQQIPNLMRLWLMRQVRDFFNFMPTDEIQVMANNSMKEKHGKALEFMCFLLDVTNAWLGKPEVKPIDGSGILFYNVSDDLRYKSLYDVIKQRSGNPVFYRSQDLGFDRAKREWTRQKIQPLEEFFSYLVENNIKTLVTINSYLVDAFMEEHGCCISPILQEMGVRNVRIRNDPPDMAYTGYLRESFHYNANTLLFSNLQVLTEEWQKICNTMEATYVAIPQDYRKKASKALNPGYKVIVLSNSRWESAKQWREVNRGILTEMSDYSELTTWYMALRRLNLESDARPVIKQAVNSQIHQFFFVAAQELKYMILENLIPNLNGMPLEVYGDIGWENVCKDFYRGSLDNDGIERLFERDDIVMLLMNCSYTYLDASGPVYDMIRRGVPWVNIPPVVKTEDLQGLTHIEYDSKERLVGLLQDVRPHFEKAGESLEIYRDLLERSTGNIVNNILKSDSKSHLFLSSQVRHGLLMDDKVEKYIATHEDFLRLCMKRLFGWFRNTINGKP